MKQLPVHLHAFLLNYLFLVSFALLLKAVTIDFQNFSMTSMNTRGTHTYNRAHTRAHIHISVKSLSTKSFETFDTFRAIKS